MALALVSVACGPAPSADAPSPELVEFVLRDATYPQGGSAPPPPTEAPASGIARAPAPPSPAPPSAVPVDAGSVVGAPATAASAQRAGAPDGGAEVAGGDIATAAQVLAGLRGAFRDCYQRALARDRSAKGAMRVRIVVDATGQVTGTWNELPPTLSDPEMLRCVHATLRSARFAPPEGGRGATVILPLRFVKARHPARTAAPGRP